MFLWRRLFFRYFSSIQIFLNKILVDDKATENQLKFFFAEIIDNKTRTESEIQKNPPKQKRKKIQKLLKWKEVF